MLERILNKKVEISVAFNKLNASWNSSTARYTGTVVAYDDNFVVFENGDMIAIKWIQTIIIK